jgi:hypothetical protein
MFFVRLDIAKLYETVSPGSNLFLFKNAADGLGEKVIEENEETETDEEGKLKIAEQSDGAERRKPGSEPIREYEKDGDPSEDGEHRITEEFFELHICPTDREDHREACGINELRKEYPLFAVAGKHLFHSSMPRQVAFDPMAEVCVPESPAERIPKKISRHVGQEYRGNEKRDPPRSQMTLVYDPKARECRNISEKYGREVDNKISQEKILARQKSEVG